MKYIITFMKKTIAEMLSKNRMLLLFSILPFTALAATSISLPASSSAAFSGTAGTIYSVTIPAGVCSITIACYGAGGGGGGGGYNDAGPGGGGGGYGYAVLSVTPGKTYYFSYGAGGSGGYDGGSGNSGGNTWFGPNSDGSNPLVKGAGGGGAGGSCTTLGCCCGTVGGGGTANVGTTTLNGGSGGQAGPDYGGAGGGGAGPSSNGGNGGNDGGTGGAGGGGLAGKGGNGQTNRGSNTGNDGTALGGGGSGNADDCNFCGTTQNGGNGANGGIVFTYTTGTTSSSGTAQTTPTTGEWYNYAYNKTNVSGGLINLTGINYAGYYKTTGLDVNTVSSWTASGSPSDATGYAGTCVGIDYHTVSSIRKGFPCGNYTLSIASHDDDAELYINGTRVWAHIAGCCDVHSNVWTGNLGPDDIVEIRHAEGGGDSYHALTFTTNATYIDAVCTAPSCDIAYVDPTIGSEPTGITAGSPANPYKTISTAISSGALYIRVAKGSGTETNIINIPSNCVIEGGYVRSGSGGVLWTKSSASADKTIITFSGTEEPGSGVNKVRHVVAFKSDNKTGWTVKDMDIITADATGTDANNRGASNYGFLIINSSSEYTISRVDIKVGKASKGSDGTTPGNGGGGAGGAGGAGGTAKRGCGNSGNGGAGTNGADGTSFGAGIATSSNAGALQSVASGSGGCCSYQRYGNNGNNGQLGANGPSWVVGDRPATQVPTNSAYYIPASQAERGSHGQGGGGGSGGKGSAGGEHTAVCGACDGRVGGNGGRGGDGGSGGFGGFGGGGAFGIWRYSSSTGANIEQVNVGALSAGLGGNGADGSLANNSNQNSGRTNGGSHNSCYRDNKAGNGGYGGAGGNGGRGRDGANGTSAAMVVNGTTTTLTASIPFTTVTIDNFSQRGNTTGKMCRYSEIELSKTSGTWATFPTGLDFVKDKTVATTSYDGSSPNIKVTTDDANKLYDISNVTNLKNFLYVSAELRTLPSITLSASTICVGGQVTIGNSNSWDVSNIKEYEYIVFQTNAQTPYDGGAFNSSASSYTTPEFTTAGTYYVRYRERHNCCGWSRPVYETITVVADPSAPTATKSPNVASVCAGQTLTLTGVTDNGGGTGTCTVEYQVNGAGAWSSTLPSFAATVGTNSISVRKNCNGSGCDISPVSIYSWTVVADPSAPTATKSPNVASVCEGQTLTLTGVSDNGGGTGTCTIEYQVNGAGAWSATLPSFAATVGTNSISVRKNCNGSGCDISPVSTYSWTVVADPTLSSPSASTICNGGTTSLSSTLANGVGTATYQWQYNNSGWGNISNGTPVGSTYTPNNGDLDISGITSSGNHQYRLVVTMDGLGCDVATSTTAAVIVQAVPTAGDISVSDVVVCPNNSVSFSNVTSGSGDGSVTYQWEYSNDGTNYTTFAGTGATNSYTVTQTTWFRRTTVSTLNSVPCYSLPTVSVKVYANDDNADGNIASISSDRTCVVADNNWHYFRNDAGEIIAAINSQGEDLGYVTMAVNIQTTPHHSTYLSPEHGDGGFGRNKDCNVLPELSVKRWYDISSTKPLPSGKNLLLRLFLTPDDYSNYTGELLTWHSVLGNNAPNSYAFCYGTTNTIIDLAVSRNESYDVPASAQILNGGVAEYQLTRESLSTYRFHTKGGIGGPLPIELLSFTGYNDGVVNKLNWTTGSEVNTNQFEIQRSLDGITWETIGSVTARGAQMVTTDYNFEDANPTQGDNYYRLKIIDNDASFEYSSIIRIKVNGTAAINAITQVFPNPTTGKLNVWVAATDEQDVVFNISDALGRAIQQLPRNLIGGMNKLEFNFDNLASGTYIISYVDVNGNKHYHKFVKD